MTKDIDENDDWVKYINPNFTYNEINTIKYAFKKAEKKGIRLNLFKRIITEKPPQDVKRIVFNKAIEILEELIEEGRLPIYNKVHGLVSPYKGIIGDYIKRDHPEFQFYADQINKRDVQIIYEIKALFGMDTTTDTYIGHTAFTKKERMITHLNEAIKLFVENYDLKTQNPITNWLNSKIDSHFESNDYYPSRFILKTFLEGLKRLKGFTSIKELYTYSKRIISNNGDSTIKTEYENIVEGLIENRLLTMNILEVHLSTNFLYENENWYKLPNNYKKTGTIYPERLNMHDRTEGKTDYRTIPLYDTSFLIALGYRPPIITEMLNELYEEDFHEGLIRKRLKESFNNYYKKLFKPVFEKVLEKNPNINRKLISKAVNRGDDFFYGDEFREWYGESTSLKDLKKVLRSKKLHGDQLDWNNVQKEIDNYYENQIIKGFHKSQWISWFIDKRNGIEELAKKAGYSDGKSFSLHFWKLQRVQETFRVSSMKEAIIKYRRRRIIKEMEKDPLPSIVTLEKIFVEVFGYREKASYHRSSYYWKIMSEVYREIFPELDNSNKLSPKQFIQEVVIKISPG